jgi:preprotein translocase subunit YajC
LSWKVHMKSVILPVVSYGCITWFLMLREQHRLRVFEKRVLMKMFVAKGGGSKRRLE